MPIAKTAAAPKKAAAAPAPATSPKTYFRLKRLGANSEQGLAQFYHGGRLYRRAAIYQHDDSAEIKRMIRTRRFEYTTSEDVLAQWKREAKQPRGVNVAKMQRGGRAKDRAARRRGGATELLDTGETTMAPEDDTDLPDDQVDVDVDVDQDLDEDEVDPAAEDDTVAV